MHRVYSEDILPCLTFPNADVREEKERNLFRLFFFYSFQQEFF